MKIHESFRVGRAPVCLRFGVSHVGPRVVGARVQYDATGRMVTFVVSFLRAHAFLHLGGILLALVLLGCEADPLLIDYPGQCGAPAPAGWYCGECAPEGYEPGEERCSGALACDSSTHRGITASAQDQALLLPAAPDAGENCCPGEGEVTAYTSVWVPAGVRAAVRTTVGRGIAGEPWRCGEPAELAQCLEVDGGERGARAWVLASPGAPAGWIRMTVDGSCDR